MPLRGATDAGLGFVQKKKGDRFSRPCHLVSGVVSKHPRHTLPSHQS